MQKLLMMSAGFLAALSVAAAPVVITSDTTYTVQSQLDAAADGIVIDEGATLTLNPGTSGSLSVNHAISGAGGVAVTSGTVTFAVASSYSGGTDVSNAKVSCSVTDALGSGEVSIDGSSAFVAYTQGSTTEGAAEVKNAFRMKNVTASRTGTTTDSALRFTSTTVGDKITFSGAVTCENGFSFIMNEGASKVATFTGGITGPATGGPHGMSLGGNKGSGVSGGNNKCIFDCVINAPTFKIRSTHSSFEFGFKKQGNVWLNLYNDRTTVTCYGENVLAVGGDLVFDNNYSIGTLDLNGFSQTVRNVYEDNYTNPGNKRFVIKNSNASTSATLTMNGTRNCDYLCYLQGKLNLVWNPAGDYAFTIKDFDAREDSSKMTMAGTVTVKAGRFVIDPKRVMSKLSGVSAEGTGRFEISKIDAVPVEAMSFAAADDGVIDLPCDTWLFSPLTLNGTSAPGYYAGTQVETGVIVSRNLGERTMFKILGTTAPVTPVPVSWKGNDGDFSDAGSWLNAPDFTTGTAQPTFAAGTTATVDGSYKIAGLTFSAAGTYTLAAGSGAMLEFSQGETVIPPNATVVINSPVRFAHGHRFMMGFGSALKFLGKVEGNSVESVSFVSSETKGARDDARPLGVVHFINDESDFLQDMFFTNTCLYVKGESPLGIGLGSITLRNEEEFHTNDKILALDGAKVGNPIKHDSNNAYNKLSLYAYANTTNHLNGHFDLCEKSRYITVEKDAQIVFTGGLKYSVNNFYYKANGSGKSRGIIIVRNKPMVFTKNANFSNGYASNLRLECSSNCLAQCTLTSSPSPAWLTIAADDALVDTKLKLTNGMIDLNGHDVTFLQQYADSAAAGVVTSATPAKLIFSSPLGTAVTNVVGFTLADKAGVGQAGGGTMRFAAPQTRAIPISLAESGTLLIDSATTLKRRSEISVSGDSWRILVADGVIASVHALVDEDTGQSFKSGFYGGPNSSARRKMANFGDGTGILMVGDVGFMMNVR